MSTNSKPTYSLLRSRDMWGKPRKGRFDVFEQRDHHDTLICFNIGVKDMAEQLMKRGVPMEDAFALERRAVNLCS